MDVSDFFLLGGGEAGAPGARRGGVRFLLKFPGGGPSRGGGGRGASSERPRFGGSRVGVWNGLVRRNCVLLGSDLSKFGS